MNMYSFWVLQGAPGCPREHPNPRMPKTLVWDGPASSLLFGVLDYLCVTSDPRCSTDPRCSADAVRMVVLQLGTTLSEYFEFAVDGLLMWAGPCMSSLALSCAYSHVSSTSSHSHPNRSIWKVLVFLVSKNICFPSCLHLDFPIFLEPRLFRACYQDFKILLPAKF